MSTDTRSLLEKARTNPEPGDADAFRASLEDGDASTRRLALDGLGLVARRHPDAVLEDLDPIYRSLEDADADCRARAVTVLSVLQGYDDDAVLAVVGRVAALLDDAYGPVRRNALAALARTARASPERVRPFVADVLPLLDADVPRARRHAVALLARVSIDDGGVILDATPRLVELFREGEGYEGSVASAAGSMTQNRPHERRLEAIDEDRFDRHRSVRSLAGLALSHVAAADPDTVVPFADDIAALLSAPDPQVQLAAAETFVALAHGRPESVASYRESLGDCLNAEGTVRARAAQALAVVGGHGADVASLAVEHASALRSLLDHDAEPVRGAAATLLAIAAEVDPAVVEPAADRLADLRDDGAEYVRAAAEDALGRVD